jgi:hypothetical protein
MKKIFLLTLFALMYLAGTLRAQEIIFVQGSDPATSHDSVQIAWLADQGYDVTVIPPPAGGLSMASYSTLQWLNSADLVILGRSVPSTTFQPPNRAYWNAIKAPVMQCSGWACRSSRANWFNSGTAENYGAPDTVWANILEPGDAVFSGVTLDGDSLDWMVARHSAISVPSTTATNAEILARSMTYARSDSNYVLFARFEPYVEFYPGSGDYPAGYYTYFGFGNDESGVVNTFPLTDNARTVYLAEIERMLALPKPAEHIMFVQGTVPTTSHDSVQIAWLRDQGYEVTIVPPPVAGLRADTVAVLNRADLVILGRSVPSTTFQPPNREYWNSIKSPVLQCSGWACRSSRANWFNSGTAENYGAPDTVWANILIPGDGVFSGVTLDGDSLDWMIARHSAISVPSTTATNAEILARSMTYARSDSNYVLFARFEPLAEFYPGSKDFPAGYYTYFGFGNDESGVVNTFPLTENARTVYLAEIERMLALPKPPEHIMFIQGTTPATSHDSVQIQWLRDAGYTVTSLFPKTGINAAGLDTLKLLNKADLVILGRSVPSTTFQPPAREYWNSIKVPVMQCSGWACRNSRSNWFNSGTADNYGAPDTVWANILMPNDAVFSGVPVDGDSLDWMIARHSAISVPSTTQTNASILARSMTYARSDSNYVLFARFTPLTEFYTGSVDYPSGRYTYFGFGNDESGVVNTFPLTDNARAVYLAEIQRMIAGPLAPLSGDADLRSITPSEGALDPAFDRAVTEYSLAITSGATTVNIAAVAHPNATVAGAGDVDVPGVATITVTANNGTTTKVYTVTVTASAIDDATLSDLLVDGVTIPGFDPATLDYDYTVAGTTVPVVTAVTTSANATAVVTPASAIPGTTTVLVTAEDGTTTLTYSVNFAPTSIDPLSIKELEFYPNPAMNTLTLLNIKNVDYVEIYNLTGERTITQQVVNVNGVVEINVAQLSAGFYMIRAYANDNLIGIGKFAKQ